MGTISVSLPSDGTTADVSDYNTPINTIVNEINGELDNANIASDAAIAGSKLADSSVSQEKLSATVGFAATSTANISDPQADVTSYTENADYGNDFASGVFTAPVDGFYHFSVTGSIDNVTADNRFILYLFVNGNQYSESMGISRASTHDPTATLSENIPLSANDTVKVQGYSEAGTRSLNVLRFSGYLIAQT